MEANKHKLCKYITWEYPKPKAYMRIQWYFFITLFIIGVLFWIGFLHSDDSLLTAYDWGKENAYLDTLRLAQINGLLPWQWREPFFHDTDKFLAIPEVVLTPDIILLRWLSNNNFVIFHLILFYATGFFGSFLIAKKLNASNLAFTFFWLIFNFNGYITAHMAIGHFQWTGYFLIPLFFIILFKFEEQSEKAVYFDVTSVLSMAFLFGVLFLNGSAHVVVWCSMFLVIVLLLRWRMFPNIVASIFFGFILGLGRLLPAAIWFPKKHDLFAGYLTFSSFLDAFTSLRLHDSTGLYAGGAWEYDFYIGFVAFTILSVSLAVAIKQNCVPYQSHLFIAAGLFLLLSFGYVYAGSVYAFIKILPSSVVTSFVTIERVPSRFAVIPFTFFLIISITGIDELLRSRQKSIKFFLLIGLPLTIGELFFHFNYWRVDFIEQSFQNLPSLTVSLTPYTDQTYMIIVYVSWAVSLFLLIVTGFFLSRDFYANRKWLMFKSSENGQ